MSPHTLIDSLQFGHTLRRLCLELIEQHGDFKNTAILGLQPRGVLLSRRIAAMLTETFGISKVLHGELDITFFRDDVRTRDEPLIPGETKLDFLIEQKNVVLVDDVLYTGRTIRAAMDAMLSFGRPGKVELLVLIDRRYSRHLPIQPDYTGRVVDTITSDRVKVFWKETDSEDRVMLITYNKQEV